MNKTIRRRAIGAGSGFAVIAASSISPRGIVKLAREGQLTHSLWWYGLTAGFALVALLLEAFEVGRHTRHRGRVNSEIVRGIVGIACVDKQCPQLQSANKSIRETAMAVFYREIDIPSREVSFYQWAWYYSAVVWTWLALAALALALAADLAIATRDSTFRWIALALLVAAAVISFAIQQVWAGKTLRHARSQLLQIRPRLGGALAGASCENAQCPST